MSAVLNFNVGVLGHIDSGKTSLAKVLSAIASTASFDKNPQSQERGITIDLGFSSFSVPFPDHLRKVDDSYETLQFTLVDCPGHASLIRTIIGGSQIIDFMILVIDATKGIQTQTAECLVIGEITCEHMVVAINKIDLLPEESRQTMLVKLKKKILKGIEKTKFVNSPMITIAANPGGGLEAKSNEAIGIKDLIDTLVRCSYFPRRSCNGPFMFAVDHCFGIKGQGSVMTGTVVQGQVSVSDSIEIPSAKLTKKVKSIQMFKKPVDRAIQGDRIGICVAQFDPKLLERGIVCSPGYMNFADAAIAAVEKIPYFKGNCLTGSKFHISIIHETVIAKCSFFSSLQSDMENNSSATASFDFSANYSYAKELLGSKDVQPENTENTLKSVQYVLLEFERPVIINNEAILIGSKLDMDIHSNVCRLAFHGKITSMFTSKQQLSTSLSTLNVYKMKSKEGFVERLVNENEVICSGLFKKETKIQLFTNLKVTLTTGESGVIVGSFGQSGKVKIFIPNCLSADTIKLLGTKKKKENSNAAEIKVSLIFKKHLYDEKRKIVQT